VRASGMHLTTRRAAIVGGVAAAATLAVALTLRKPGERAGAPTIRHFVLSEGEPVPLRRFAAALVTSEPPKPPPAIRFTSGDGKPEAIGDFAGKGVVLNLWATWCAPCGAELPSLDALAARLAAAGIVVLPLSSDRDGATAVQAYYRAHGITHLGIWLDPDGAALSAIGAPGIPTTLILDRQGRELARLEGGIDWSGDDVPEAIRKLIG
jgi:thiol-disulfide isomerase/thioredoxin